MSRVNREVIEEKLLNSHESEFPMSLRRLAEILEVSHPTIMRAGNVLGHKAPFDKITCYVIADEVSGGSNKESGGYEGPAWVEDDAS